MSDGQSERGNYTEAFLSVTVDTHNWRIPINATFVGCYVEAEFCICDDLSGLEVIETLSDVEHEINDPTSEIELQT